MSDTEIQTDTENKKKRDLNITRSKRYQRATVLFLSQRVINLIIHHSNGDQEFGTCII